MIAIISHICRVCSKQLLKKTKNFNTIMTVIQRFSKLRLLLVKWTFSAFKIKVLGSWHILQTMRIHWDWQMNVWILQPNLSGCSDNWRVIHRHCLLMCNRRPASADLCAFLVLLCTAMWWDCVVLLSWGILLVLWSPAHPPLVLSDEHYKTPNLFSLLSQRKASNPGI